MTVGHCVDTAGFSHALCESRLVECEFPSAREHDQTKGPVARRREHGQVFARALSGEAKAASKRRCATCRREQVPSRWHPATTAAPPYRSCGTQQDGLTRCTLAPCAVVWRHFGSCEQHVAAAARIRCRRSGPRPCPPYRRTATRGAQQAAHSDRSGNSSGNCHFPPFPLLHAG